MSVLDVPSCRRCVPVRLTDIDREKRLHAARIAVKLEHDPDERELILSAALFPSDTVYWVAPGAEQVAA